MTEVFVVVIYWRSPAEPMKIIAVYEDDETALMHARDISTAIPAYRPEVWRIPVDAYWSHAATSWLSGAGSDVRVRYPSGEPTTDPFGAVTNDPGGQYGTVSRVRPYLSPCAEDYDAGN